MSTNLQLCTDTFRFLGVVGDMATPPAEMGVKWLRKANQFMAEQAESDMEFKSWFPQTSTGDTCPIPDYAERWLYTQLAKILAPDYGVEITVAMATEIEDARAVVLRKKLNQKMRPIMPNLPAGEGDWNSYSILNG